MSSRTRRRLASRVDYTVKREKGDDGGRENETSEAKRGSVTGAQVELLISDYD
jgi:hypothetical protein